jgi:hypothetical protein
LLVTLLHILDCIRNYVAFLLVPLKPGRFPNTTINGGLSLLAVSPFFYSHVKPARLLNEIIKRTTKT